LIVQPFTFFTMLLKSVLLINYHYYFYCYYYRFFVLLTGLTMHLAYCILLLCTIGATHLYVHCYLLFGYNSTFVLVKDHVGNRDVAQ